MTLEHYDSLYREYPKLIADESARTIENARIAFATAAQLVRISEEERMLSFDGAYRAYLARVRRRLLPYVY